MQYFRTNSQRFVPCLNNVPENKKNGNNSVKTVFSQHYTTAFRAYDLSLYVIFQISIFDNEITACSQTINKDIKLNTQKGHNYVYKFIIETIVKTN